MLRIGQMSFSKISNKADYLQLDICGLNKEQALEKYKKYNKDIPVILHGDWTKKGCSENNLPQRYLDYIEITEALKKITTVYGITIHPPFRKKVSLEEMLNYTEEIKEKTGTPIFIENRSNKKINLSTPEEIIDFSKSNIMTIDIPQLYISCGYDENKLIETLMLINHSNVKEYHFANILSKEKHTYVGRKLYDGDLNLLEVFLFLNKNAFFTLEILGQLKAFEESYDILNFGFFKCLSKK